MKKVSSKHLPFDKNIFSKYLKKFYRYLDECVD